MSKLGKFIAAAILAIVVLTGLTQPAMAQTDPYSGCNRGFRMCWDYGEYLPPSEAQRHRGLCTNISNLCIATVTEVRATGYTGLGVADVYLFPRGTAKVRIDRTGQSYVYGGTMFRR